MKLHSAKVKMHLELDGVIYPVAQMGPDFLILKQDLSVKACSGEVVIEVDGSVQSFPVTFDKGVLTNGKRIQMDSIMNNDKPKTDSLGWSDLKQDMRSRCYSCDVDLESSIKPVDLAGDGFNLSYSVEIQKCPACQAEYFPQSYFDKPREIINQIKESIDPLPFTNAKPTEEGVFEVFFDVFKYTRPNFFIIVTEFDGVLYAYYNWKDYFKDGALVPLDDLVDERLKFRKSHKKFDSHFKTYIQDTAYRSLKAVHESKFFSFLHKETKRIEDQS